MNVKKAAALAAPKTAEHLVALDRFILATRDSGYKGTGSAVAELVDNALQAGATKIWVNVDVDSSDWLKVQVTDNGCGMEPATLAQALRFGGSSRFNDRSGLGRYGMGLPNSSFSQARRVEVVTWRSSREAWTADLDLDEIAQGKIINVPTPSRAKVPALAAKIKSTSGTIVTWLRCDRLDYIVREVIRPTLLRAGLPWYGLHAFRRGLATNLHELAVSDIVIQAILRHSDVSVTRQAYIKNDAVDPQSQAAMATLEKAVQNQQKASTQ